MKKNTGFTLIELLVTLVLAGILLSAGIPGMQTLLANMSISSNREKLINSITYARGEAVARVNTVSIRSNAGTTDWSSGWTVFVDDGDCAIEAGEEQLRVIDTSAEDVTITATTNPINCITFNRFGENNLSINRGFSLNNANGAIRNIDVSNTGHVTRN